MRDPESSPRTGAAEWHGHGVVWPCPRQSGHTALLPRKPPAVEPWHDSIAPSGRRSSCQRLMIRPVFARMVIGTESRPLYDSPPSSHSAATRLALHRSHPEATMTRSRPTIRSAAAGAPGVSIELGNRRSCGGPGEAAQHPAPRLGRHRLRRPRPLRRRRRARDADAEHRPHGRRRDDVLLLLRAAQLHPRPGGDPDGPDPQPERHDHRRLPGTGGGLPQGNGRSAPCSRRRATARTSPASGTSARRTTPPERPRL